MKKFLALVLALCMVFALCVTASAEENTTYKVGVVVCQNGDDFMTLYDFVNDIKEYFQSLETDSISYELNIVDFKDDAVEQIAQIQDFIDQGADVVLLNLSQFSSAGEAIDTLVGAGIPVVLVKGKLTEYSILSALKPAVEEGPKEARIDFDDSGFYFGEVDADGHPCGIGSYTSVSGEVFDGVWEWCVNSVETYVYAGKHNFPGVFTGMKRNGQRCGYGTMLFDDGGSYYGEWLDNEKTGYGLRYFPDNSHYLGTFENGNKEGRGTLTRPDGSQKTGKWHKDQFAGS